MTAILLVVILAASGCGGQEAELSTNSERSGVFSAVAIFGEDTRESHDFVENETFLCMKKEGIEYRFQPYLDRESPELDSREIRTERGFGDSIGESGLVVTEETFVTDEERFTSSGLTEEERLLYIEIETGCRAEARDQVLQLVETFVDSLDGEDRLLFDQVQSFEHPRMLEAGDAWAACMASEGFRFAGPGEMIQHSLDHFTEPEDLEDEIALAVADWDCSASPEVREAVDDAYRELDAKFESAFTKEMDK